MYPAHNEGKSVVAENFIRILKNEIYKHMTPVSKNVDIDKLDDIVKYNNTYHSTIKTKPVDVKSSTYIDFDNIYMRLINNYKTKHLINYHQATFESLRQPFLYHLGYLSFDNSKCVDVFEFHHICNSGYLLDQFDA